MLSKLDIIEKSIEIKKENRVNIRDISIHQPKR